MNQAKTILLGVAILGALAVALFLWKYGEWVAIPNARAPMVALLKDPASAKTRNERITKAGALCGEVNAKNGMGGYAGFKRYISLGPESNYIEGTGSLSKATTEELVERFEQKNAMLKTYLSLQRDGVDVAPPSESRMDELIEEEIFRERWQQLCEAKSA
ncbi:hypothetical protein AB2N08_15240 [Massilia aurea]|uniref:hypothetical protein n=1 Tax=Massilia aurea TaxID=373040 RepID=UPI0034623487